MYLQDAHLLLFAKYHSLESRMFDVRTVIVASNNIFLLEVVDVDVKHDDLRFATGLTMSIDLAETLG
jgi:hypothetical protein